MYERTLPMHSVLVQCTCLCLDANDSYPYYRPSFCFCSMCNMPRTSKRLKSSRNVDSKVEKRKSDTENDGEGSDLDNRSVVTAQKTLRMSGRRRNKVIKVTPTLKTTKTQPSKAITPASSHIYSKYFSTPASSKIEITLPSTSKATDVHERTESVQKMDVDSGDSSSCEDDDWEEVEMASDVDDKEPVIPKEGVQITLELPDQHKGRRAKKAIDWDAFVRRKVMRYRRDVQEAAHKVHLLCLMAGGIGINRCLREQTLRAAVLSLQPTEHLTVKQDRKRDQKFVERVMQWYRDTVKLEPNKEGAAKSCSTYRLMQAVASGVAHSELVYVGLFLICLLNCGMDVRLVVSLQPLPLRLAAKSSAKKKAEAPSTDAAAKSELEAGGRLDVKMSTAVNGARPKDTQKAGDRKVRLAKVTQGKSKTNGHREGESTSKTVVDNSGEQKYDGQSSRASRGKRRSASAVRSYKDPSEDESEEEEQTTKRPSRGGGGAKSKPGVAPSRKSKVVTNGRAASKIDEFRPESGDDDDDDFEIEYEKIKKPGPLKGSKQNRKTLSSESDDGEPSTTCRRTVGNDHWIEVYLVTAKCWICVDCVRGAIDCPHDLEEHASKPMSYVLAFDTDSLKDVTRRYASGWMSQCRKLRVSAEWWDDTLTPFLCRPSKRDSLENQQLEDHLLEKPLPKSISEYKNHPLYVLTRHLLKFQGIYPPDSVPVGYMRGESVYSRDCVHTLHSRETWVKDARLVKKNETAYKAKGELISDLPLELFGKWQTEDYVSPPAENGIVPRNEYGNVELFKSSMLPKGTVHLQLNALNRVAKKLGIDCARAMTGWDFHGVGSHPTFDGWVVCEEFKEVLEDAWREEQIAADKRDREKREKRIYGNWRRLIRGLLIGKRLANRYSNKDAPLESEPFTTN